MRSLRLLRFCGLFSVLVFSGVEAQTAGSRVVLSGDKLRVVSPEGARAAIDGDDGTSWTAIAQCAAQGRRALKSNERGAFCSSGSCDPAPTTPGQGQSGGDGLPPPMSTLPPAMYQAGKQVPAPANVIYVDKNDSSCGNGGGSRVHCSIQSAVNAAQPGTAIRIRASSSPYTETVTITRSGATDRPIIIESEAGQMPILTNHNRSAKAAIDIQGSHVVVRNLTFQGGGVNPASAIAVTARNKVNDVVIEGNTIRNWGETELSRSQRQHGISVSGRGTTNGVVIRNNSLQGVRGMNIVVTQGYNAQIYGNTITGAKCDTNTWGGNRTWTTWQGIKVGQGDGKGADGPHNHVIHDNIVAEFDPRCPGAMPRMSGGGIWCDTGVTNGRVYNNRIVNVQGAFGMQIESRCANWNVYDNIIADTKGGTKANYQTRNAPNATFSKNISCGGATAFLIKESLGAKFIGNLASGGKRLLKTRSKGGQTSVSGSDSSGIANSNSPACQNPYKAVLAGACLK